MRTEIVVIERTAVLVTAVHGRYVLPGRQLTRALGLAGARLHRQEILSVVPQVHPVRVHRRDRGLGVDHDPLPHQRDLRLVGQEEVPVPQGLHLADVPAGRVEHRHPFADLLPAHG